MAGEKCPRAAKAAGGRAARISQDDSHALMPAPAVSALPRQSRRRLRVALIDNKQRIDDFVRKAFAAHAEGWVLEIHRTAHSALGALRSPSPPDVVLLEVRLSSLSGVQCVRQLAACQARSRIVIFSVCTDDNMIVQLTMAGAFGYLIKPVRPEHLVWAISEVAQGRLAFCAEAQAALLSCLHRMGASECCTKLSGREREIMLHLLRGLPNKDIASELGISAGTVHRHLDTLYKKLGVHGRDAARRKFMAGE